MKASLSLMKNYVQFDIHKSVSYTNILSVCINLREKKDFRQFYGFFLSHSFNNAIYILLYLHLYIQLDGIILISSIKMQSVTCQKLKIRLRPFFIFHRLFCELSIFFFKIVSQYVRSFIFDVYKMYI